jgi:hypothetical protein
MHHYSDQPQPAFESCTSRNETKFKVQTEKAVVFSGIAYVKGWSRIKQRAIDCIAEELKKLIRNRVNFSIIREQKSRNHCDNAFKLTMQQ